jgi:YVTN family beta-propeller protein
MKKLNSLLCIAVSVFSIAGCDKIQDEPAATDYSTGVYIVNEGTFMASNGSISYFDPNAGQITNGVFEAANLRPAGDVVQSFAIVGDTTGYIVVNGSGKVEIVRLRDFKTTSAPIPVFYPRYFMQVSSNKGYLTAGSMQGLVYVVNLTTRTLADSVEVGYGPETMVRLEDKVFVANSGGWGADSTVSVLDVNTDQVSSVISVGKIPNDMALDKDNNLWVYCKGYATYSPDPPYDLVSETDALIQKVDPSTGNILWQHSVGKAGDYTAVPPKLAVSKDGSHIYYIRPDGVYDISTQNPVVPSTALIEGSYYGIEVNPTDGHIFLFEGSFTGNGTMKVYDTFGLSIGQGTVGIAPNGAVFNME